VRKESRFEEIFLPFLDAAYNLARWIVSRDEDEADIVQEASPHVVHPNTVSKYKGSPLAISRHRSLSCNWDVDELTQLKDQIIQDDLLVNRLRTKA